MSQRFSKDDVAAHKKPDDLWIIVDEDVYDLTKFQEEHPGKHTDSPVPDDKSTANNSQAARRVSYFWRSSAAVVDLRYSPPASRRQRRLEAVLEVPQRVHPQEIPGATTSRIPRYQSRAPHTTGNPSTRREASTSSSESGARHCLRCAKLPSHKRGGGSTRSVRRSGPIRRSIMVSIRTFAPPSPPGYGPPTN